MAEISRLIFYFDLIHFVNLGNAQEVMSGNLPWERQVPYCNRILGGYNCEISCQKSSSQLYYGIVESVEFVATLYKYFPVVNPRYFLRGCYPKFPPKHEIEEIWVCRRKGLELPNSELPMVSYVLCIINTSGSNQRDYFN